MKIAVSSMGKDIEDKISDVFGRCPYFIIAEIEGKKIKGIEAVKNESIDQMGGAGISTARLVADKNVNAVITGNVGPRALDVLRQFNIEIYSYDGTVKTALQTFVDGKIEKLKNENSNSNK
jgi:predicted Fe-Mo cluster-binding NifX family protein